MITKTPEQWREEIMNCDTRPEKIAVIKRLIAESKAEQAEEDGNDIISRMTQHPHPTDEEKATDSARANDAVFLTRKGIMLRQEAGK